MKVPFIIGRLYYKNKQLKVIEQDNSTITFIQSFNRIVWELVYKKKDLIDSKYYDFTIKYNNKEIYYLKTNSCKN